MIWKRNKAQTWTVSKRIGALKNTKSSGETVNLGKKSLSFTKTSTTKKNLNFTSTFLSLLLCWKNSLSVPQRGTGTRQNVRVHFRPKKVTSGDATVKRVMQETVTFREAFCRKLRTPRPVIPQRARSQQRPGVIVEAFWEDYLHRLVELVTHWVIVHRVHIRHKRQSAFSEIGPRNWPSAFNCIKIFSRGYRRCETVDLGVVTQSGVVNVDFRLMMGAGSPRVVHFRKWRPVHHQWSRVEFCALAVVISTVDFSSQVTVVFILFVIGSETVNARDTWKTTDRRKSQPLGVMYL